MVVATQVFPCRRHVYDRTGSIGDAEDLNRRDFKNLYEFFRSQLEEVCPNWGSMPSHDH